MERQSLNLDLDKLFPGDSLTIGDTTIIIRPLGFEQIATILKKVDGITTVLAEKNITFENYSTPENLLKLALIVLENFPTVLEEASNIDMDDLKKAPLELIATILDTVIKVNLKSKDSLEKNFKSLTKNFLPEEKETQKIQKKRKR